MAKRKLPFLGISGTRVACHLFLSFDTCLHRAGLSSLSLLCAFSPSLSLPLSLAVSLTSAHRSVMGGCGVTRFVSQSDGVMIGSVDGYGCYGTTPTPARWIGLFRAITRTPSWLSDPRGTTPAHRESCLLTPCFLVNLGHHGLGHHGTQSVVHGLCCVSCVIFRMACFFYLPFCCLPLHVADGRFRLQPLFSPSAKYVTFSACLSSAFSKLSAVYFLFSFPCSDLLAYLVPTTMQINIKSSLS